MNRHIGFANFFVFAKIFDRKVRKSANFSLDTEVYNFFNYCYWMYKHTQISYIVLPDCSFKICEKPSQFSKRVRVVIDVSP